MRLFTCLIFFAPFILSAQIQVKVLDAETKTPVPFATIAFKQKNIGFNANVDGVFIIPNEYQKDTLMISSVGYYTTISSLNDVLIKNVVLLEKIIRELDTAIIKKRPYKTALNNHKEKNKIPTGLTTLGNNYQAAQFFEAPQTNPLINKITISLHEAKEVNKFRLRFYDFNDSTGGPGLDICSEVIEIETNSKRVSVDVSKYYITPSNSKFFVAIEWIIKQESEWTWPDGTGRKAYSPVIACFVDQPCSIWMLSYNGSWSKYNCKIPKALKISAIVTY